MIYKVSWFLNKHLLKNSLCPFFCIIFHSLDFWVFSNALLLTDVVILVIIYLPSTKKTFLDLKELLYCLKSNHVGYMASKIYPYKHTYQHPTSFINKFKESIFVFFQIKNSNENKSHFPKFRSTTSVSAKSHNW